MSRTFRRLKSVIHRCPYPYAPYVIDNADGTMRAYYRAIGDGPKGQWSIPGEFTRQTANVKLRRYAKRAIHRATMTDGWDGFTVPRKWPRPWWW